MKNYPLLHKSTLFLFFTFCFATSYGQEVASKQSTQKKSAVLKQDEIIAVKEQSMMMKKRQPYTSAVMGTNSIQSQKIDRNENTQSSPTVAQVSFQTVNDSVKNKFIPSKNKAIKNSK